MKNFQQDQTLPLTSSRHIFDYLAITSLYLAIISLPFSTGYIHTLLPVAAVFSLLSGYWKEKWHLIIREPFIKWTLILMLLFVAGIFYSQAGLSSGAKGLMKYTKLLYVIPLMPLFFNQPKRISYIFAALQIAVFTAVIMSIGHELELWQLIKSPESKHIALLSLSNTYINPIPFGVFVAFSVLFSIHFIKTNYKNLNWVLFANIINIIPLSYYVLSISIQRSTFLLFIAAIIGYLWFSITSLRYKLMALTTLVILSAALIFTMPNSIIERTSEGYHEITTYLSDLNNSKTNDTAVDTDTSFGYRAEFIRISLKLMKENPFGVGTGAFAHAYKEAGGVPLDKNTGTVWDPHNEFLMVGTQIGIIGLLTFIIWLLILYQTSHKLPVTYSVLLKCSMIILILNSISAVSIYYSVTGVWYVIIFSALIATKVRRENSHNT